MLGEIIKDLYFSNRGNLKCNYCNSVMEYDGDGQWYCSRKKCNCIAYWYPEDPIEELEWDETDEWDYDDVYDD